MFFKKCQEEKSQDALLDILAEKNLYYQMSEMVVAIYRHRVVFLGIFMQGNQIEGAKKYEDVENHEYT